MAGFKAPGDNKCHTSFLDHAQPAQIPVHVNQDKLVIPYAGQNRIEDELGIGVNFFHLDCLASAMRLNVDLDAALTVIVNGCYRWLATQLRGFDKAAPKQLYRRFVETGGTVRIESDQITMTFDRRSHNSILREAAPDRDLAPVH